MGNTGEKPVIDWNEHKFAWNFDAEMDTFHMDLAEVMNRTLFRMREMEEDATLSLVIIFLRDKGYVIQEPQVHQEGVGQ